MSPAVWSILINSESMSYSHRDNESSDGNHTLMPSCMTGYMCMSTTCFIFRSTKKYIFNQKRTDINLNILNLQKEL